MVAVSSQAAFVFVISSRPAWLPGPILGEASPPPTHPAGVERGMWSSQQPGPADCHSSVSWASAGPHMHLGGIKNKPLSEPLLAVSQNSGWQVTRIWHGCECFSAL